MAGLLDHLMGLTLAFRHVADGQPGGSASASAADLDPAWRTLLPDRLEDLASAWRRDAAWEGEAFAGSVTMPAEVMGVVALDELVLHGWDLARATDQEFAVDSADAAVLVPFLEQSASPVGTPGLFGPALPVAADAAVLDRLLCLAGRDPGWAP